VSSIISNSILDDSSLTKKPSFIKDPYTDSDVLDYLNVYRYDSSNFMMIKPYPVSSLLLP